MKSRYGWFFLWLAAGILVTPGASARDYYVSAIGFDSNSGTLDLPFRTIQKAATAAAAGDTVYVRAGVYRETVTPANSGTSGAPITFQPYNGESVTVSGADVIPSSSWTLSNSKTYKAPLGWDLGEGANQVFLDGQMMIEARWPNTTLDVSHPIVALTGAGAYVDGSDGFATGIITGLDLPSRSAGYWNGATIHISPFNVTYNQGPGWSWQTGTVVNSATTGQLSFTWSRWVTVEVPNPLVPGPKNPYYLTGKLSELDAAGEWFLESATSTLYFWTLAGDTPASHLVEAKRRQVAFNLNARSFITIQGISVFAATITSDALSQYLVLDGLKAQYISHFSLLPTKSPQTIGVADSGILLNGKNNVLRNSTLAFSAGNGVAVAGIGHRVFNNVVHDANYVGGYPAPIASAYKPTSGTIIAWNTVYNAGRFGILHSAGGDSFTNGRILHNEIYNCGLQTSDMGCTYSFGSDGKGTEIAYNVIHQDFSQNLMFGVYFDFDSSNHIAHHNVVSGVQASLRMNTVSRNNKIYNNTFAATLGGLIVNAGTDGVTQMPGSELKNNIFTSIIGANATPATGAVLQNNILKGTDPQFVNAAQGNFQLKPTSPAIGAGLVIPPYTDGFTGTAPDAGAYDHGKPAWKAGVQSAAYTFSAADLGPSLAPGGAAVVFGTAPFDSGVSVMITDGAGVDLPATLLSSAASPPQLSFTVPATVAAGVALITITNGDGTVSLSSAPVFPVYPFLNSGQGLSASGGGQSLNFTFPSNVPWTASSNAPWITFTGLTSGTGNGTLTYQVAPNPGAHRTATITVGGFSFIVEQAASSISGFAAAGSLAQVASEGTWKFTLAAVNLGASSALARFNFADNAGNPLALPLTFPQLPPAVAPLLAATLDRAVSSNAQLVMESTGPDSAATLVGSGQLLSNGNVSGFGIFSNPKLKWNAVVPLETRNASKYILAFDNTAPLTTGVAVANLAAQAVNVPVIIRDGEGVQIGSPTTPLSLPAQGHTSFMLNDPTLGFPVTSNKRGTIEFDTPPGGQISVLGLRANGAALTTLPVLANVGITGGSITHLAYNGGWTSVFYLVNTGNAQAQFTLSFYDESGVALPVPLVLPQSGTNITTATLTQVLAAGAMLLVNTQAQDAATLVVGSAQLTTTGNISGFEIFRWTTFSQEASVPLETRAPNSFVLVFDDTNGLTTGVALANLNAAAASVTVRIYDDAGTLLQTAAINLGSRGHTSFMLPDNYSVTANKRGMVEFVVPQGAKISAIGLRAKNDGTLTTIPVLTK